jgi:type I restriction enzyme R subunit
MHRCDHIANFNKVTEELLSLTPTVSSVDDLPDENAELAFVTKFREMLRLKNVITSFSDYKPEDLGMSEQSFEDYKSKYLDIYDKVNKRVKPEEASVLEEIDFELSLIHRDEINVAYILNLLVSLEKLEPDEAKKRQKEILDLVAGEVQLRSKRKLIEEFIESTLPTLKANENVISKFESYWGEHKNSAFKQLCKEENIAPDNLEKIIHEYEFANKFPRKNVIKSALTYQPKVIESKSIVERIAIKIRDFMDTYIEGMGGST